MLFYSLVKLLDVKVSLVGMIISLLVLTASVSGFSFLIPISAVASPIDDDITTDDSTPAGTVLDNISLNATAISTIELADQRFAVGRYSPVSETMINETQQQLQVTFEGSTTITLPNSTETITTRDRGEGIITFLPGGGEGRAFAHGQIHLTTEDGSETATADIAHYPQIGTPTTIGLAYFSTNSTGMLAPLNNIIAVFLHEEKSNGSVIVPFFKWKGGRL
jgi:hypothetical protein